MIRIRSRSSWGAPRTPGGSIQRLSSSSIPIVHHTGSFYGINKNSSKAQEAAVLRNIRSYHMGKGWSDIAYSHLIFPSGRVYTGRGWNRIPAGAIGWNTGNWHPCVVGNYELREPSEAAVRSLRALVRRFRKRTGSKRTALGHLDVNPTDCPGTYLLPRVRKLP